VRAAVAGLAIDRRRGESLGRVALLRVLPVALVVALRRVALLRVPLLLGREALLRVALLLGRVTLLRVSLLGLRGIALLGVALLGREALLRREALLLRGIALLGVALLLELLLLLLLLLGCSVDAKVKGSQTDLPPRRRPHRRPTGNPHPSHQPHIAMAVWCVCACATFARSVGNTRTWISPCLVLCRVYHCSFSSPLNRSSTGRLMVPSESSAVAGEQKNRRI
jgi:hypothetical protein